MSEIDQLRASNRALQSARDANADKIKALRDRVFALEQSPDNVELLKRGRTTYAIQARQCLQEKRELSNKLHRAEQIEQDYYATFQLIYDALEEAPDNMRLSNMARLLIAKAGLEVKELSDEAADTHDHA
jgi:hypothetical protein